MGVVNLIIVGLMTLIRSLLSLLLVFNLPAMPDSVHSTLLSVSTYLGDGISVIRAFIGPEAMGVMSTLLVATLAINAAYYLYTAVFWILEKIPMLGIKK